MSRTILMGWLMAAAVAATAAASASAATPAKGAPTKSAAPLFSSPTSAVATEEQRRASEISTSYASGNLAEAQAAAEAFMKSGIKDDKALLEVGKVLGDCQRKKGEWARAAATYTSARSHCEKDSEDYVRLGGMGDVMRASPNGLYTPPGTPAGSVQKSLSEDDAFVDALARLGSLRATKIKMKVGPIKRATSAQQVVALYAPCAADAREMFILGPNLPADAPHEAATAAGARLQEINGGLITQLQTKFETYRPKFRTPWVLTNIEKDDIANTSKTCTALAEVEKSYQQTLAAMSGKAAWPEQEQLQSSSAERLASFTKMATEYTVPKYTTGYGSGYYY
jgi:hypothetical protein